ncbi:hypothetical protein KEJ18_00310 [Candidatus Bathyarchaeota archaeon]|nr:hypothetical protein [Candidatus Bathyarchaeota archaeon]
MVNDYSINKLHEKRRIDVLPSEISNVDEFVRLSEKAKCCLVKRKKDTVKLKLMTSKMVYTLKVDTKKANEILKKLKCETREI